MLGVCCEQGGPPGGACFSSRGQQAVQHDEGTGGEARQGEAVSSMQAFCD